MPRNSESCIKPNRCVRRCSAAAQIYLTMPTTNFNWNATTFLQELTKKNKFAQQHKFIFCRVSGLEGFEETLAHMQQSTSFVCVSDISNGYTELNNSPHTRRVKTVFMAMRHAVDDMTARQKCIDTMRELFRQFMTVLILESTRLKENFRYLDPRITFNEIDRYFFSGCACCYFQIAIDTYTDLRYNQSEWTE